MNAVGADQDIAARGFNMSAGAVEEVRERMPGGRMPGSSGSILRGSNSDCVNQRILGAARISQTSGMPRAAVIASM